MQKLASSWMNTITKLGFGRARRKSSRRTTDRGRKPSIENLENRQMLSITVNTLVDQNDTYVVDGTSNSLREAIAYAATQTGPQEIDFDPSLAGGTIDLTHGQLTIASDMSINGLGTDQLTINAQGSSRVFLNWATNAVITGVTITGGGSVDLGAGIYNGGNLMLDSVNVSGNSTTRLTTGNDQGGGIYSLFGSLDLINSTIDDNHARWNGGVSYFADDASDLLYIFDSTISNNDAVDVGGNGAVGGLSVYSYTTDAKMSIINSTFSGNSSPVIGAIDVQGDSHLQVVNSTITNNTASVGLTSIEFLYQLL